MRISPMTPARGGKTFIRGAGMLVLLVIAVVVAFSSTSCVRTGHVGVVSIFGRVTGQTLSEGIHIGSILPPRSPS